MWDIGSVHQVKLKELELCRTRSRKKYKCGGGNLFPRLQYIVLRFASQSFIVKMESQINQRPQANLVKHYIASNKAITHATPKDVSTSQSSLQFVLAMLMVELSSTILTISGLHSLKTHLEGKIMEIQCVLMFFIIFLPFNQKNSTSFVVSRWRLRLWQKQLYMDVNINSILETKLKVFNI